MDWSLIALLFAVGFALMGLAFLITTVSKVMTKPPPSQNSPPTPQQTPSQQPYQQAQPQLPSYNWTLNGARVQKLALGQGSGGGLNLPINSGQPFSMGGPEEGEPGLIPISCSVVPAQVPLFEPEPVHLAQRVYEEPEPAPLPNSVAVPVEAAPEANAVATPASYFRETPTVQDVSSRKIKEIVNRAGRASSVAAPVINPDGEARGFFRDQESEIIEVMDAEILDETAGVQPQNLPLHTPAPAPPMESEPDPQFEPEPELHSEPDQESAPPPVFQFAPEPSFGLKQDIRPKPESELEQEDEPVLPPEPDPPAFRFTPEPSIKPKQEPEPESEPEIVSEPESQPVAVSEPESDPASEAEQVPDPESETELEGEPEPKPKPKPVKRKKARGNGRHKRQQKKPKPAPVPNAPPAEKVDSQKEEEKKPDGEKKPEGEQKPDAGKKSGLKERAVSALKMFVGRMLEKVPEPIRNVAGPVLFCVCVAVCLLFISLGTYFEKHPNLPTEEEPPVVVDVPTDELSPEPEPEKNPEPVIEEARYKMAMLGEQEAVSTTADGFEPNFETADYTDVPFFALAFAIQLDSDPGTEFQKIQVFDADTMEDLTSTANSILHVYTGEVPSEEYFLSHPVKSAPVVSSAVSDEIITCVFVSLEKRSIYDLKVILSQATSGSDTLTEKEIMVNGRPEDLMLTPAYTMGSSLIRLGEQYYVAEAGTGIGAVPDENKYVTRKIRCVSLPLTGSVSGLEASSTALFDRQTGERRELPAGVEMYYQENYEENQDVMEIEFGVQLSSGSYEEAAAFFDASFPGYVVDGKPIMF